jgi:hypothetical protein
MFAKILDVDITLLVLLMPRRDDIYNARVVKYNVGRGIHFF